MAKVIAGMTVSLDGFISDADGSTAALYPDFAELVDAPYMKAMQDETGAVLMGRRTFGMAENPDDYADSYEFQVPIFVVTHVPPALTPKRNERLSFTFVRDGVREAVARAIQAGGACGDGRRRSRPHRAVAHCWPGRRTAGRRDAGDPRVRPAAVRGYRPNRPGEARRRRGRSAYHPPISSERARERIWFHEIIPRSICRYGRRPMAPAAMSISWFCGPR